MPGQAPPPRSRSRPRRRPAPAAPAPADDIDFSADQVSYDNASALVVAEGRVRMNRDGYYLASDRVEWNRDTGSVVAIGNVVILSPEGDRVIGNRVVLDDSLRDGTVEDLLVVLESGGRVAAPARDPHRRHPAARPGDLHALPGDQPDRLPAQSKLVDQRGARDARSGRRAAAVRRRAADHPRHHLALAAGVQRFRTARTTAPRAALLIPNLSVSSSNGAEIGVPYYLRLGRQ